MLKPHKFYVPGHEIKQGIFTRILSPIVTYAIIYFLLALGDSFMSYGSPVIISEHVQNSLVFGLILSSSSMFGLFFDLFSTKFWPNAPYTKFLRLTFIATMAFPLTYLILPKSIPVLVLGMAFWGAYYEFRSFSTYGFIKRHVSKSEHTKAWATVNAFSAMAYLIGPLMVLSLIDMSEMHVTGAALIVFIMAALVHKITKPFLKDHKQDEDTQVLIRRSNIEQLKIVITLFKSVWHLFIYTFALYLIDSAFWSIGILFSEELRGTDRVGGLFIALYMLPSVFTAFIAPRIPSIFSKKRLSFTAGAIAGIVLIAMASVRETNSILFTVLLMAIFYDISLVLNLAVFEDYVSRLGKFANDMAGINQAAISLAYIVGPILWGYLAQVLGYHKAFALSGVLLASVCLACLAAVPRKVKMPQVTLSHIE